MRLIFTLPSQKLSLVSLFSGSFKIDSAIMSFLFLIKKQQIVNPNVALKKKFEKKVNCRENVYIHSIVYSFTKYSPTNLEV